MLRKKRKKRSADKKASVEKALKLNKTLHADDLKLVLKNLAPNISIFPYQEEGIKFCSSLKNTLLADAMGVGKTFQALATSINIKAKNTLIICLNSLKYNWAQEIEKFFPGKIYQIISGGKKDKKYDIKKYKDFDYTIINYESLNSLKETLEKQQYDCLIIDEAHKLKNPDSKMSKTARKSINAHRKILLTGTPLTSKEPIHIWSLMSMIYPNEYKSFKTFTDTYCSREFNGFGYSYTLTETEKLHKELNKFMIRRLKKDVLKELPDKTFVNIELDLEDMQESYYEQAKNQFKDWYKVKEKETKNKGQKLSRALILTQIIKLNQISSGGTLHLKQGDLAIPSNKIRAAKDLVESITNDGQKALIFTQFKPLANQIAEELSEYNPILITGDITIEDRDLLIKDFQNNPERKIFIATIQTASTGLTLHAANHVIFLDKPFNPTFFLQGMDRVHRVGQKNPVTVYSLISKGTIQEHIESMIYSKLDLSNQIIDGGMGDEFTIEDKTLSSLLNKI